MLSFLIRLLVGLAMVAGLMCWSTPEQAEAKTCPPGTVAKKVKVKKKGKDVRGWLRTLDTTKCVKRSSSTTSNQLGGNRSGTSAEATKTPGERFCRVDSEVEGISDAEMDSGYLVVNGNRWRKCPDGLEEMGDPSAESMTLDLDALARSLAVQLNLPDATPIFSPDPNNNEWKMLAVGFPIWLRTDGPDSKSTTASTQGLTFRLSATRTSTTFTMGDGKTITCNAMARYSDTVKAGSPSPNCGHTYHQPSGKNDRYTVTGTHHWTVTWSVDSYSGSFPMTYSDSSTIRIGELSALNR